MLWLQIELPLDFSYCYINVLSFPTVWYSTDYLPPVVYQNIHQQIILLNHIYLCNKLFTYVNVLQDFP
jgi:hypothetical protein